MDGESGADADSGELGVTHAVGPLATHEPTPTQAIQAIVGMFLICVLDWIAGLTIDYATVFDDDASRILKVVDTTGQILFWIVAILAIIAVSTRRRPQVIIRIFAVFLLVATLQLLINIFALVTSAGVRDDTVVWGLWDVGAVYMVIVAVFTGWYWLLDVVVPGGAFVFPKKADHFEPKLVDYVFIAFNTNATFGPTSESVVSRRAKVAMMLQTACSLLILLVFIARIVVLRAG